MMVNRKRARLTLVAFLVGTSLGGLLTGGIAVGSRQWFGGQETIQLKDGTEIGLWLEPTQRRWNAPFIAHYFGSEPPFTLQLWIPNPPADWESATIEEVSVHYADGTVDRRESAQILWRRADREMALWGGPLRHLVTRHIDCTVGISMKVSDREGETDTVSFFHSFETEPGESFLAPYWWALGQQG